jgi:hypothetical protein
VSVDDYVCFSRHGVTYVTRKQVEELPMVLWVCATPPSPGELAEMVDRLGYSPEFGLCTGCGNVIIFAPEMGPKNAVKFCLECAGLLLARTNSRVN